MSEQNQKILESTMKNLRGNLDSMSLDNFVGVTIETLMNIERDEYLDQVTEKDNGNGFYGRALKTFSNNSLMVKVPRTREGGFSPASLELLKINQEKMDEMVLSLYTKGVTCKDIKSFINEIFSEKISPSKISDLVKVFNKFRTAWENSPLEKRYKVIYMDVIFITVKRGNEYSKEGLYVAIGLKEDNKRELVALSVNPTESASEWGNVLENLKKRGVEQVDLFVADGIKSLENEISRTYYEADFQKCCVHKIRQVLIKIAPKDKEEVAKDLKHIFDNFESTDTEEKALVKVNNFLEKWKEKYPYIKHMFEDGIINYYFTYIKFSKEVRRMIYTTNSIENLNRQIRKTTKNKLSFENTERLLDFVFMIVKEFEEKNYSKYPISNFKNFRLLSESDTQN
jgi:transposase-like protein